MASKKSYSRYFIILQQDENGYSISSDKLPSGYTKLETKNDKCKVSYYVQNLKKEKEPYYMVLICSKKDMNKLIKLGELNIDEYGRAEITYEYEASNIGESNISVDMVTGAAVVKYENTSMLSVMSGFATSDVPANWRSFKVFENQQSAASPKEIKVEEKKIEEAAVKTEVKEKVPQEAEQQEAKRDNMFDEYEKNIEEDVKADKFAESAEEDSSEGKAEVLEKAEENTEEQQERSKKENKLPEAKLGEAKTQEKIVEEEIKSALDTKDEAKAISESNIFVDEKNANNQVETEAEPNMSSFYELETPLQFFDIVAEGFQRIEGICPDIKRCTWYKVKVDTVEDMCNSSNYNRYTIAYQPMITYYPYISNFGHYLFGYKYDTNGNIKYIVYAVPGKRNASEQPYAGKSGFVTWVSSEKGDAREDETGYWLMFYDYKTSTIVIPVP